MHTIYSRESDESGVLWRFEELASSNLTSLIDVDKVKLGADEIGGKKGLYFSRRLSSLCSQVLIMNRQQLNFFALLYVQKFSQVHQYYAIFIRYIGV